MSPQLVDLNADGKNDMVMATFEGTAFLVEGSDEGYRDPVHILDEDDELVRISMYWDLDEDEYLFVDRSSEDEKYIKEHHLTSSAVVDWDNDGDQDLILGAYEGALYLCKNNGTKSEPKFATTNVKINAGGKHLTIPGGLATPRVCDWNQDGLFDILCGGAEGGVYFYKNIGAKGKPEFAKAQTLIAAFDPPANYDGYAKGLVPVVDGMPAGPGSSFHIEPVDYDGDGDLDLLIGGNSRYELEGKELTKEEESELAEIEEKTNKLNKQMSKMMDEIQSDEDLDKEARAEAFKKIYDSEDFKKLQEEMSEMWERRSELKPGPESAAYIWLYRNNGGDSDGPATEETESAFRSEETLETGTVDSDEPTVSAKFMAGENEAQATLTVQLSVPAGYHVYGAKNATAPTTLTFSETGDLEASKPALVPNGRMVVDSGKRAYWLENVVTLEQQFDVPDSAKSTKVQGEVEFMMCNAKGCLPPKTLKFEATLNVNK